MLVRENANKFTRMKVERQPRPSSRNPRKTGRGQLTLVEHALCPLDPNASLVENLVHESAYFFTDANRHWRQARARIICPSGLSANDEFYLWGLLALTFAQPEIDANLHATPHYCLRHLGVIDQHTRRGGRQYGDFATAIERLSQVTYLNDQFYDPVRAEHRKVSFGFLSYSLPLDPESSRAWRIAWDPIFFDIIRASGGSFRFDLAVYRELDPASRRLFLLLSKIMSRRSTSPRFDVRHLAVNVLGFAPTITTRDLKIKVWRCVERLIELQVVRSIDKENLFRKTKRGEYAVTLECGDYFAKRRQPDKLLGSSETALDELLRNLGFDDDSIRRLLRRFPMAKLREWTDITLAAKERFGHAFFKKSPQAYLVDNLKNAVRGMRTPPDWWHDVRRAEARAQAKSHVATRKTLVGEMLDVPEEARQAYERIAAEMFAVFRAGGQPEAAAKANAEKFAREHVQRPGTDLGRPLFGGPPPSK
jgi:hypothetical protein